MSTTPTEPAGTGFAPAPWAEADRMVGLNEPARAVELPIGLRRRRGFSPALADGRASVALQDDEGMLRWVYRPPPLRAMRVRARRAGLPGLGAVLARFDFEDIGPNRITEALAALDMHLADGLSPPFGLRQWQGGALRPLAAPPRLQGRTLLLLHGTFSNSAMWFGELGATPEGRALLAQWTQRYGDNILAFTHPTLSMAPWLNALDLHAALAGVGGELDIVCHSRGGLVASWLLRLMPARARTVAFIGSPLQGTSLASPYRLRVALDMLANMANALALTGAAAATVFPLAAGAAGLAKVLGKTLKLGAALPVAEAVVGLVPGLASQQRITNNIESQRLFNQAWLSQPRFLVAGVNFEPQLDQPAWKFWTRLRNPLMTAADLGADALFPGDNDLVVDTDSMMQLGMPGGTVPVALPPFTSAITHHTSYFRDAKVLDFLARELG